MDQKEAQKITAHAFAHEAKSILRSLRDDLHDEDYWNSRQYADFCNRACKRIDRLCKRFEKEISK